MMKLDTLQEQRAIIEELVKKNSKFSGNEDLLEDFCSETYKRSHTLFESAKISEFNSYLVKVVNTAILTVLKDNGRVRRRENRYVSTKEIFLNPLPEKQSLDVTSFIYEIEDPRDSFEEKIVRKDLLQKIVDIVLVAQKNNPSKEYFRISPLGIV